MKGLAPMTPPASVTVARDVAYGDDPLQKIDIYTPAKAHNLPIAVRSGERQFHARRLQLAEAG
jgi:hypothetical protein